MANIPTNVSYGTVVGQFIAAIGDTTDSGREPDAIPMQGYITFTPNVSYVKNLTANPNPVTIAKTPVIGILDVDGYLCSTVIDPQTGLYQRGITLVATDDIDINPSGWTWKVSYSFTLDGRAITSPTAHSISVPSEATIDLTSVSPVASSTGDAIVQGPRGMAGDMVAVFGPADRTGAVVMDTTYLPSTRLWNLTGNVTLTLPTPDPLISGTITLVLTQDAIGGRTITWPTSVKWPDGIAQQPAGGPSTTSVIHLLWTGAQWLGLLGGKSFA
jgi:hypothetical protein